jgi:hypothetical protein
MCCVICGKVTVWLDRFGRCSSCSPLELAIDTYGTELIEADTPGHASTESVLSEDDAALAFCT